MFNKSSHVDASHSTFSEVHRDQYYSARSTVQGSQTINTIIYGNQINQDSHSNLVEIQKASAPSASYDSAQRFPAPKCIEGTRVELLECLTSWIDKSDQKPICWLNGRPGSGKSAVSQTIAETYADKKRLAASFFFSRRDLERRTTQHVVPTLTMQLLTSLPSIRPAVISALENDYMIPMKVLREQMEKLLLAPVSTATEAPDAPLLIIIDALDECDDENSVLELLSLLSLLPQKTSLPLRLLITSRAEPWLQSRFHRPDVAALTLSLEIHTFSAEGDIRSFLRRALDDMYDEHLQVMKDIPRPWPPSDELDRIVNKAGGLFIFALTVVKFIGDRTHNPVERLQAIIGNKNTVSIGSAYADLDSLYRDAISVFPDPDVARLILGIVYCMAIPLSISALHKLLQRPDVDARAVVPALSSVLLASEDGKQPIQFYHASFRDFLTDPQRSRKYAISPDAYHRLMAQLCLDTMSSSLKRDICGIGDPARANKEVPDLTERRQAAFDEALLYACRFWSRHIAGLPKDGMASEALISALRTFSTTVLLCWIEALSILDALESAVLMLRESISWLKTLRDIPEDVLTLMEDADRLVVLCIDPISQCALHVYVTAIAISPPNSAIYKTFYRQPYGTFALHPRRDGWSVLRTDLNLHHPIYCVDFSPNDEVFATAGANQGVQLWNTITGGNIASLGERSSTAHLVYFSPSGGFLAAAFEGSGVTVWDPKVGREHLKQEGRDSAPITCMEFSKNSALLACGARDHAIYIWSMETAQLSYRLTAHEGPLASLVFSSDSLRLFSGSEDNLIIAWDMSGGKVIRGMMGHRKAVNCLATSKNGSTLASGSEDKTIKLWDTRTGICTQTFSKGHRTGIRTVHFFDEDRLLTACDETIQSWNIASRNSSDTMWTLEEFVKKMMKCLPAWQTQVLGWATPKPMLRFIFHKAIADAKSTSSLTKERLRITFSTRSPSFAFSTRGFTFSSRLQIPLNDVPLGGNEAINALAISSDGGWAILADPSGSLQILDLTMPHGTWKGLERLARSGTHHGSSTLIPSSTGTRFIVDGFTQWVLVDEKFDIIKKLDLGILVSIRDDDSFRFKFSPDGCIFFSVVLNMFSDEKSTLRVFDSVTGGLRTQFSGLKKVQSFVASIGGAWIACGSTSGQVDVLGVANKEQINIPASDDSPICLLCFSDDAQELVGGSRNGVVRVWDHASGMCKATFNASTSMVTALVYMGRPGGDTEVAIGREDGSVSVWSPKRSTSHDIISGDQALVKKVDFIWVSKDGTTLLSRGEDGTVFTWAIAFHADGADKMDLARCTLCNTARQEHNPEGVDGGGNGNGNASNKISPHLLSKSDPEDAIDSFFHTSYRVRKEEGWLLKGDRRVMWLPPSIRPSGKDMLWAYDSGLVVFFTTTKKLIFLKCAER